METKSAKWPLHRLVVILFCARKHQFHRMIWFLWSFFFRLFVTFASALFDIGLVSWASLFATRQGRSSRDINIHSNRDRRTKRPRRKRTNENEEEAKEKQKWRSKCGIKSSIVVTLLPLNPKPWNWNWWNSCSFGWARFASFAPMVQKTSVLSVALDAIRTLYYTALHFLLFVIFYRYYYCWLSFILLDFEHWIFLWLPCVRVCIVAKPNISDVSRYRFFVLRMWYVHGWFDFVSLRRRPLRRCTRKCY